MPATGELLIQQLNRLQNTNRLFLYRADQGAEQVLVDQDDAWVDVHDELLWLDDDNHFTWPSDRDGWRHIFVASRDGQSQPTLITPGEFDVVQIVDVDEPNGQLYFIASPGNATQRYLYRVGLDGQGMQRLTPERFAGSNSYQISPDGKWAIHQWSSANQPPDDQLDLAAGSSSLSARWKTTKNLSKRSTSCKRITDRVLPRRYW